MPNFKTLIAYLKDVTGRGNNIGKVIIFFSFASLLSFKNTFAQNQSVGPGSGINAALPFDNNLHVLYLKNTDAEDHLNQILSAWKNRRNRSKHPKKLIFQFIYKSDHTLSLIAFAGRKSRGRSHYQSGTTPVILTVSSYIPKTDADITGKDVIFGDQEINIAKDENGEKPVNVLFDIANHKESGNACVYFTPQLVVVNGNTYTIQYSLSIGDSSQTSYKALVSKSINISTNPSPPRNSY